MTPKQKAQELLSKYTSITLKEVVPGIFLAFDEELCKKFALIAVDEILNVACDESDYDKSVTKIYWQQVKQIIETL
jgi:hypothetical protein